MAPGTIPQILRQGPFIYPSAASRRRGLPRWQPNIAKLAELLSRFSTPALLRTLTVSEINEWINSPLNQRIN